MTQEMPVDFSESPRYQRLVRETGRMIARILRNVPAKTVPITALAEANKPIGADLFVKIAEIVQEHPDQDIVVFIKRFEMADFADMKKKGEG